jgi:hypothetical protein
VTDVVATVAAVTENEPQAPSIDASSAASRATEPLRAVSKTVSKTVSAATSNDNSAVSGGGGGDVIATATAAATAGATELAGRVRQSIAETGGPLFDRVEESPLSTAVTAVDRIRETRGSAQILELLEPVTESVRALSDSPRSAQVDDLLLTEALPTTGSTSPTATGVRVLSPPSNLSGGPQHFAGAALAAEGAETTIVAPSFLSGSGGGELSRLSLAGDQWRAGLLSPLAVTNDGHLGGDARRSENRTPVEAPVPAPGSTEAATGLSGSTFIPLVALLALLALAAPATGRRLREAPQFRAPTPFVCALERPG